MCVCERDDAGPKFTLSPKQKLFAGELGPGHIWCGGAPLQLTLPSLLAAAGAAANSRFTSSSSPLTSRQSSHTCPLRRAAAGKPTTQTGTPSFSSPSPTPTPTLPSPTSSSPTPSLSPSLPLTFSAWQMAAAVPVKRCVYHSSSSTDYSYGSSSGSDDCPNITVFVTTHLHLEHFSNA